MIKMKASKDEGANFHVSSAGPDNITAGQEFSVSNETEAKQLEDRKLATRVGGAKAEAAAPENKAEAAPANKAISAATAPARAARKAK
jgi:hypothetical protein